LRGTFLIDNLTLSIKELGIVSGAGGDDLIVGGPLADTICGNAGHDRIYGNAGDDRISGGDGADYLEGDQGNDRCMAIVETMDSQDGKVMIIWMGARETTY
jgi:Ca2+-binding RTX toxin-like protein